MKHDEKGKIMIKKLILMLCIALFCMPVIPAYAATADSETKESPINIDNGYVSCRFCSTYDEHIQHLKNAIASPEAKAQDSEAIEEAKVVENTVVEKVVAEDDVSENDVISETTTVPETIAEPETTVVADTIVMPETSVVAETPAILETTVMPETPAVAETPAVLETTVVPETSAVAETPAALETTVMPETLAVAETPEVLETPVVTEMVAIPETTENLEIVVTSEKETPEMGKSDEKVNVALMMAMLASNIVNDKSDAETTEAISNEVLIENKVVNAVDEKVVNTVEDKVANNAENDAVNNAENNLVNNVDEKAETTKEVDQSTYVPAPDYYSELDELYRLVESEAGIENQRCKEMVTAVVMNRVESDQFPNSVHGVIHAKGAFSVVSTGAIRKVKPSAETIAAVNNVYYDSVETPDDIYFFRNKHYFNWCPPAFSIGRTFFSKMKAQ